MELKYITDEEFENLKNTEYESTHKRKNYKFSKSYYSNDFKVQQRCLNKYVKAVNKSLENDFLYRSRFFIRQYKVDCVERFTDGSGAEVYIILRIYDKRTMKYLNMRESISGYCHSNGFRLWHMVNNALVRNFFKLDKNDNLDIYKDRIDYKAISSDYAIKNSTPMYDYDFYVRW